MWIPPNGFPYLWSSTPSNFGWLFDHVFPSLENSFINLYSNFISGTLLIGTLKEEQVLSEIDNGVDILTELEGTKSGILFSFSNQDKGCHESRLR